jgi:hypothetical protein
MLLIIRDNAMVGKKISARNQTIPLLSISLFIFTPMIIVDVKDFKLIYHRRQASGTKYFQGSKQGIAQKILLDKLVALHTFNS